MVFPILHDIRIIHTHIHGNISLANIFYTICFLSKTGIKAGLSPFTTSIDIRLVKLVNEITQGKKIKGIQIGKKKIKLSLFIDDIYDCLCRKPKETTTTKLLKLKRDYYSKIAGYY